MQFLFLKIAKETSCDRAKKKSFEPTSPPALVIISEKIKLVLYLPLLHYVADLYFKVESVHCSLTYLFDVVAL